MPTVTLFAKAHGNLHLDSFDRNVKSELQGLRVEVKACRITSRGWIQVSVSGEDEIAALHYLDDRIGLCPDNLENIHRFSTLRGRISSLRKSGGILRVDIGVSSRDVCDAVISLSSLQAQLVDGRNVSIDKITRLFGLCEDLPFTIKIENLDKEKCLIEADAAYEQRRQWIDWTESLLDRLMVLGASSNGIESALERAGFRRDVVSIEPLGGLEFVIVCKLGTDAVGLIPKIGKYLGNASFAVFSPRRILAFFGNELPLPIS